MTTMPPKILNESQNQAVLQMRSLMEQQSKLMLPLLDGKQKYDLAELVSGIVKCNRARDSALGSLSKGEEASSKGLIELWEKRIRFVLGVSEKTWMELEQLFETSLRGSTDDILPDLGGVIRGLKALERCIPLMADRTTPYYESYHTDYAALFKGYTACQKRMEKRRVSPEEAVAIVRAIAEHRKAVDSVSTRYEAYTKSYQELEETATVVKEKKTEYKQEAKEKCKKA